MKRDDSYPLAYILQAALEDGDEQAQIEQLLCEAANLIFDLVERARAFDEELARGYRVKQVKPRKARGAQAKSASKETKSSPRGVGAEPTPLRLELRYVPRSLFRSRSEYKIAERDGAGTRVSREAEFKKHLNSGLLDEIGIHFVHRLRATQQQRRNLEHSLRDINHLRHLLLEEQSPDSFE